MQKHKENVFLEKFSLLNSQEHTEDIKWSSSSCSDYENASCREKLCNNNRSRNRKRKRKKKPPKNTSNLEITIIDPSESHIKRSREKSPILLAKSVDGPSSPILKSRFPPNKSTSPIIEYNQHQKSPILTLRNASPKYSIKVRKKLAYNEQCKNENSIEKVDHSQHSEFKTPDQGINQSARNAASVQDINKSDLNSIKSSDESESSYRAKLNLIRGYKTYFDSHFSSENTSLNISDTPTPDECLINEQIDILSCRTQTVTSIQTLNHNNSNSDSSNYFEKNKKVKYKKGGLAYRMNALLKKQNAHVSLWHHERFLAGTSNFVIPKEGHVVFYIQKVDFKYGCYCLEAMDVNNLKYVLLINSLYVNKNINAESVLKLYEPYRIFKLEVNDYNVIVNISKFECVNIKK